MKPKVLPILILITFIIFGCRDKNLWEDCDLYAPIISDLIRYTKLSEGIQLHPSLPHPRQSYFSADCISFGNYKNTVLIYSYAEFVVSPDTFFHELDTEARQEMVALAKQLRMHGVGYAEYVHGWEANMFKVRSRSDSTRTVFIALADTSGGKVKPKYIQLLCSSNEFFIFRKPPFN